MEIRGLGYVGLRAPDLGAWRPFAEELLGLMPATAPPGHDGGVAARPAARALLPRAP